MRFLKVMAAGLLCLAILAAIPFAAVAVTHPEKMDILVQVLAKGLEGLTATLEYMLRAFVEYLWWLFEIFKEATKGG